MLILFLVALHDLVLHIMVVLVRYYKISLHSSTIVFDTKAACRSVCSVRWQQCPVDVESGNAYCVFPGLSGAHTSERHCGVLS